MKRKICFLLVILVSVLCVSVGARPFIVFLAQQQLRKIFIDSMVTVGNCDFDPFHRLTLSGIEIKREKIYDFQAREAEITYSIPSIIKGTIANVSLKDATIVVNLSKTNTPRLGEHLKPGGGKGKFLINSFELSNLNLDMRLRDSHLKAEVSLTFSPIDHRIEYLDLKIDSLESRGLQLKNASLKVNQNTPWGSLFIDQIAYGKLIIKSVESTAQLNRDFLLLDSLSAALLGGTVHGNLGLKLDKEGKYAVNAELIDLDFGALIDDFNLNEKVQATGRLNGRVALEGSGFNIATLSGDFSTSEEGGVLTINDTRFLKHIARQSNQPLEIVVESFKNYRYNTGMMGLSLTDGDLMLDVALNGEAGKRNITVTLHDFGLRNKVK